MLPFYLRNKDYQIEKVKGLKKKEKKLEFYRTKNNFDLSKLPKIVNYFMKKDLVTKIFLL